MATNVSSVTKHFPKPQNGFTTTLSSSITAGATIVPLSSVAGYTNGDVAAFVVDPTDANKKQTFTGTIDTANTRLTGVVWTAGTNVDHTAGATVVDYVTATHLGMVSKGILVSLNQDGTVKTGAVGADAIATNAVTTDKIINGAVTTDKINANAVTLAKVENKVTTTTSTATLTPTTQVQVVTAQAVALTVAAPSIANATNGTSLLFRIKDNGSSQTISWNAIYRAVGVVLPTATTISKYSYVGAVYNATDTKWDVVAVVKEA